ncbi:MAG: hypothetical protein JWO40_285 [Candidatus Doudnabacteria bacterium]|nr:hypothetical protein [Candidatus Doudnabacteria bacterium]
MQNPQHLKSERGFTLIEALVATALFAVTVSSIVGVYLSTIKINRRTDVIRSASENARYLTEYLAKEIKNGAIDYASAVSPCTSLPTTSSSSLAIVNVDGDRLCFYLGDNSGLISSIGQNLWLEKNNLAPLKVNSANVSISNLIFYVSPTYDPYLAGSTVQPRVTFTANVKSTSGSQDSVVIPIESSITIPVYDIAAQ